MIDYASMPDKEKRAGARCRHRQAPYRTVADIVPEVAACELVAWTQKKSSQFEVSVSLPDRYAEVSAADPTKYEIYDTETMPGFR
jgi:hypothetical protein